MAKQLYFRLSISKRDHCIGIRLHKVLLLGLGTLTCAVLLLLTLTLTLTCCSSIISFSCENIHNVCCRW